MKEHYELTYIVSIKYLDDELTKVMESIAGQIKSLGGEITSDQILGKQRLAYPIKQTHQGTYVILEFNLDGVNLKKLDDQLKLSASVLRHLIIKKKIKSEAEIKREKQIQESLRKEKEAELVKQEKETRVAVKKDEEEEKKEARIEKKAKRTEEDKATFEDLDKKLDEILTDDLL